MFRPSEPELLHEKALDDRRELVLLEHRARGVIARLLAVVLEVDAAPRLEVHVEEIDVLHLHARALGEEVLDELVHGDGRLAPPVGHP